MNRLEMLLQIDQSILGVVRVGVVVAAASRALRLGLYHDHDVASWKDKKVLQEDHPGSKNRYRYHSEYLNSILYERWVLEIS